MLTGSDDMYRIKEEFEFACNILSIPEKVWSGHWKILHEALKKINVTNVYHNTSHIMYMIDMFDSILIHNTELTEKINVYLFMLSILYHDSIYVAGATDNEVVSFSLLKSLLKEGNVDKSKIEYVREMILGRIGRGLHAKLFRDIDYAILGEHSMVYRQYAKDVEDEYRQAIDYDSYILGRHDFLKGLDINQLFQTTYIGGIARDRASVNIIVEKDELRTMIENRIPEENRRL